jgi:hypothetical protein
MSLPQIGAALRTGQAVEPADRPLADVDARVEAVSRPDDAVNLPP